MPIRVLAWIDLPAMPQDRVTLARYRLYYRTEKTKAGWAFVCLLCKPRRRFAIKPNTPAEHERQRKELFDHLRLTHPETR